MKNPRWKIYERTFYDKDIPKPRNFYGEILNRHTFKSCNLTCADFRMVDLKFAAFYGCDLTAADFRGADVRFADFTHSNLKGANFTGAQIEHTKFPDGFDPSTVEFCFISADKMI